jgi:hypothetical protein
LRSGEKAAQLTEPVLDVDRIVAGYSTVVDLMRELKAIGAHNVTQGRARGLTGRTRLAAMTRAFATSATAADIGSAAGPLLAWVALERFDAPTIGLMLGAACFVLIAPVAARLRAHNAGQNPSTASHRPWELVVSLEFQNEAVAVRFEKYLKSGSGRAFAKRHFS